MSVMVKAVGGFVQGVIKRRWKNKMLKEDLVDFRISGLAIYSSAKYYHQKITSVITEEEIIQREQERERLRREIPKALSQPIREARKLATTEELFGAMRRAIIETMQKREKLRIRRERELAKKETLVERRGKGKLPAEILKHITGNDKTIQQRLQETHQKIKEIITLENFPENSFPLDYWKKIIYLNDSILLEKKVKYIQLFEELLVLMTLNKIGMQQRSMQSPVKVTLLDKTPIELI